MLKKLEELDACKETSQYVSLLSLDGGGIKGLVIIQVLDILLASIPCHMRKLTLRNLFCYKLICFELWL